MSLVLPPATEWRGPPPVPAGRSLLPLLIPCAAVLWRRSSCADTACMRVQPASRRRSRTTLALCLGQDPGPRSRSRSIRKTRVKVPVRKSCFLGAACMLLCCFCVLLGACVCVHTRKEPCMHMLACMWRCRLPRRRACPPAVGGHPHPATIHVQVCCTAHGCLCRPEVN